MTKKEAIKTLRELWRETNDPWYEEVYNMAIEALQTDVVRCKDCRWWSGSQETTHNNHLCRNWSKFGSISTSADDFCSLGQRR